MGFIKILLTIFCITIVFSFSGCTKKKDWSLFVYPYGDPSNDTIEVIDGYKSFEECVDGYKFNKKSFPKATFECGYKCKTQDISIGLYVCEETRDQLLNI